MRQRRRRQRRASVCGRADLVDVGTVNTLTVDQGASRQASSTAGPAETTPSMSKSARCRPAPMGRVPARDGALRRSGPAMPTVKDGLQNNRVQNANIRNRSGHQDLFGVGGLFRHSSYVHGPAHLPNAGCQSIGFQSAFPFDPGFGPDANRQSVDLDTLWTGSPSI